jgi:hypothetical protein
VKLLIFVFSVASISFAAEVTTQELHFKKVENNLLVSNTDVTVAVRIALHNADLIERLYGHPNWYRATVGAMSLRCEDCKDHPHHILTLYLRRDRRSQINHELEVDLEAQTLRIVDGNLH